MLFLKAVMTKITYFHFSQGKTLACCPIAIILSRILFERKISEKDFKLSIRIGTQIWKEWVEKQSADYNMMHFFNLREINPRLLYDGQHKRLVEYYGRVSSKIKTEDQFNFTDLLDAFKDLEKYSKYAGVITCNSLSYCVGKRYSSYYLCDSHLPRAFILKTKDRLSFFNTVLEKFKNNDQYEINIFC